MATTYTSSLRATSVVQAVTDILEINKKAKEQTVTSEIEETLLAVQHT